ncbi:MAG TPA: hypothetical protein VNT25_00990, partial [Allosphingosinicella sp.]|nr:hypothetical protein [Allosphingosinicella sp.]
RLRRAYAGRTLGNRIDAMKDLWGEFDRPADRYARHILTAVAASRLAPSEEIAGEGANLISSMLSGGLDRDAARWAPSLNAIPGEAGQRAWAMLAVGTPEGAMNVDAARIGGHLGGDYQAKLLLGALAGLGRISEGRASRLAEQMDVPLGRENVWTRMLDAAVRNRQPGTVAVLAAAGMQTPSWRGVPPEHLYRITRALREVGLEYEARMIAAEAMSRT